MSDLFLTNAGGGGNPLGGWVRLAFDVAALVDRPDPQIREGARLSRLRVLGAGAGAPIPRLFGRMRIGGQLIWHGTPKEIVSESGGGGDKGGGRSEPRTRSYRYTLNFAIGLCEGAVAHIGRIWADGQLLDRSDFTMRVNRGTDDQLPDPLIEAENGDTPAYRGLAYVVFQDFDLTRFGNRIPQLSFEIFRAADDISGLVRAVDMLPGATEHGYDPEPHVELLGYTRVRSENLNASYTRSDWELSLDALQESHPNCKRVALVVAWYGTDLRLAECRIEPRVTRRDRKIFPRNWQVAHLERRQARVVSYVDDRPAYGGTPSDASVVDAIRDLKRRGMEVLFYPFVMMDVPSQNGLSDPYGRPEQPVYPWRGRITCAPAPGQSGSPDGTSPIRSMVARFVNGRHALDLYCLRGMIMHYARLCSEAGGVEGFLVGSEFVGISRLRDARGSYPFADYLTALAGDVRRHLPDAKISYAADWTEYGAHTLPNGDIGFPLDNFWSSQHCDFIGIDAYFPLSDWRDGRAHLDAEDGARAITDHDYLKGQVEGGEYYDWYYASEADRDAQRRTPITDGQGEPWLHRTKDIRNWWYNTHRPRRANVRQTATAWRPQSKPIWFTETGCPAVDKGSNQPNVFSDRLSSESAFPHYSSGARDDHVQLAYLQAISAFYESPSNNPLSTIYGAAMVSRPHIYFWAWDARPFPAFPYLTDLWSDGGNWHTGHWLNGRQATTPLASLISRVAEVQGLDVTTTPVTGALDGYVLDRVMSPREAFEPLLSGFGLVAVSRSDGMHVMARGALPHRALGASDLVPRDDEAAITITRVDDDKLPNRLNLHYIASEGGYTPQVATARVSGPDAPVRNITLPLVISTPVAQARRASAARIPAGKSTPARRLDPAPYRFRAGRFDNPRRRGVAARPHHACGACRNRSGAPRTRALSWRRGRCAAAARCGGGRTHSAPRSAASRFARRIDPRLGLRPVAGRRAGAGRLRRPVAAARRYRTPRRTRHADFNPRRGNGRDAHRTARRPCRAVGHRHDA